MVAPTINTGYGAGGGGTSNIVFKPWFKTKLERQGSDGPVHKRSNGYSGQKMLKMTEEKRGGMNKITFIKEKTSYQ